MHRLVRFVAAFVAAVLLYGAPAGAQAPATDASARLRAVLPPDVAARVLARIAEARAQDLPASALENRALKFAAKGVAPADIERSVGEHADRLGRARRALDEARGRRADVDEVEAGAEAMRQGVDGAKVTALAQSAPAGRSLAVPLYVIGSLVDRGLASDEALKRVQARLQARATDADLETLPAELPPHGNAGGVSPNSHKPVETGRALGAAKHPGAGAGGGNGNGGGRPASVPGHAGGKDKPSKPDKPDKPDKPKKPGKS